MPDAPTGLRWRADADADADDATLARVAFAPDADVFCCPLPVIAGDFETERWQCPDDGPVETGTMAGWSYRRGPDIAFAACHIDDDAADPAAIQRAGETAYRELIALQRALDLPCVQRIWHWLSEPTAGAGDDQRYQRFCRGRAEALDAPGGAIEPLPPATLVAGHRHGLRMHALLGRDSVRPIENPRQVSAYRYPRDYGIRAPAFARAGVANLAGARFLLVSGTASIVGHATRHAGDVEAQAGEALDNVTAVIEAAEPAIGRRMKPGDLQCVKAYLRDPADAETVIAVLDARLPAIPRVLLHAPLCRDDLLVEFEAQMTLD